MPKIVCKDSKKILKEGLSPLFFAKINNFVSKQNISFNDLNNQ